ncbi:PLP-dependent aminotransferase family protein [Cohnella xylanilytica]|uniref:PLP-dependent aminotransferase family protein n=1 Tax=Cohnella xylanilytica TaxID=557555 RepID=A0A841TXI0_9BACL|nr:PLP-dependent aminotransferase family protein [Cohnella xylanilytica]MBB6693277.1 PLP-dependent aminotransferase family protein [Cohnella xylanilytica]
MWVAIELVEGRTIIRQVYEQIRARIVNGELAEGERLPSTRLLAKALGVSRNVVLEAYELLRAEGFTESRQGAGTYVAGGTYLEKAGAGGEDAPAEGELELELARRELAEAGQGAWPDGAEAIVDFRSGVPALDRFPRKLWGRLYEQVCAETRPEALGYGRPEGRYELRSELARYLRAARGVVCRPEQVVVTSGATQALTIAAKLLLAPGARVLLEDPMIREVYEIFGQPGTELVPVPVDEDGMNTSLIDPSERPALIYVTPSHQFPTGGVLPIRRRIDLVRLARASGGYIVEDDYDSEFRFEGPPISSLQGLEPDRVIYVGTFSKLLLPSLRLGYMILPPSLVERAREAKRLSDLHVPSLEQLAMARFMRGGHLERHVAAARKLYRARRDALVAALAAEFGDRAKVRGHLAGIHLVAAFEGIRFTDDLVASIQERGVRVYPVRAHALSVGERENELILGYGNVAEERIREGVARLRGVLDAYGSR